MSQGLFCWQRLCQLENRRAAQGTVAARLAALPCALVERSGRGMHAPGGERHLNVFNRHQRLCQARVRLRQVHGREGRAGLCVPGQRLSGALRRRQCRVEKAFGLGPCLGQIAPCETEV